MESMALPGLERLLEVCQRLNLGLKTAPPAREPLKAGSLLEGVPFDPILASVYARLGHAAFATKVLRWVLIRSDDQVHRLEEENKRWREKWWKELGEPVIVFGGEVYAYATVPGLADAQGRQPVVLVDTYEFEPQVMPVASNVDRFFDTCARYLEAKVSDPSYQASGKVGIRFPHDAIELLARDEQLVESMRAGRFDSLMRHVEDGTRRWAAQVMGK
ncbi:hypothetical protein [Archangium sp.]|uniref:hypothetical protein n=1 Tax=Archangium sp. TaxID=1872627 RepID=UPI002D5A9884|nr:hypothetical protein [Archangium sp.]HYO57802.1 hypothetical protein [Archangium sp.]